MAVTVAIVDEGGLLTALGWIERAFPLSSQIAEAKAVGAALWHRDGESLRGLQADLPAFFAAVSALTWVPLMPTEGPLLIRRGDQILGAAGVSGEASEEDTRCAEAGLALPTTSSLLWKSSSRRSPMPAWSWRSAPLGCGSQRRARHG